MPVGIGYDIHRLREGRKFVLGGVTIPFPKGPVGHSDGDVLLHAICDALLGAAGLEDIGSHFPGTAENKDISSLLLLDRVCKLICKRFQIEHIDNVVISERPRLSPYRMKMIRSISRALKISSSQVSVKAKTNEGLGLLGKGHAVAVLSVASLKRRKKA